MRDLTDQAFGRLTVVDLDRLDAHGHYRWFCACECGGTTVAASGDLIAGHTQSCGCLRAETIAAIGGYLAAIDATHPGVGGWLEWWWNECRLGTRPLQAGLAGEELRMIATIDDLARLVCEDLAVTKNEEETAQ